MVVCSFTMIDHPQFHYEEFRGVGRIDDTDAQARQRHFNEKMQEFKMFLSSLRDCHVAPSTKVGELAECRPATASTLVDQIEHDPITYRQKLENALYQTTLLVQKIATEAHHIKNDEEKGLTIVGKCIVRAIRWWYGAEMSPVEKELQTLDALVEKIAYCLTILKDFPTQSITGEPIHISENLRKECDSCVEALERLRSDKSFFFDEE